MPKLKQAGIEFIKGSLYHQQATSEIGEFMYDSKGNEIMIPTNKNLTEIHLPSLTATEITTEFKKIAKTNKKIKRREMIAKLKALKKYSINYEMEGEEKNEEVGNNRNR